MPAAQEQNSRVHSTKLIIHTISVVNPAHELMKATVGYAVELCAGQNLRELGRYNGAPQSVRRPSPISVGCFTNDRIQASWLK